MRRVDSVDVLRALALIGMVICHYPIFLSSGEGRDAMAHFFANHLLGGDFAASWFVFLVGLSQVLSAKKRGPTQSKTAGRVIIRGMVIFVIGLLFLLVIQGYEELWDWDILAFIGATTIILLICRSAPSWLLLLSCCAVCLITPWFRSLVDLTPFYGGGFESVKWVSDFIPNFIFDPVKDYGGGKAALDNVLGFFLIGQFPLLPWIIFPLIGFVVGRKIAEDHFTSDSPLIIIIGIILSFMGLFTAYAGSIRSGPSVVNDYITPLSFYPSSFSMVIFLTGIVLILFTILWYIYDTDPDNTKEPGMFLTYCRQISKYSLTIICHSFCPVLYPFADHQGGNRNILFKRFSEYPDCFCAGRAFADHLLPFIETLGKAGGKYSFEWLLAKLLSIHRKGYLKC